MNKQQQLQQKILSHLESEPFFHIKELSKLDRNEIKIKETLQQLVDERLVTKDKIGAGQYYSLSSLEGEYMNKKNKMDELKSELKSLIGSGHELLQEYVLQMGPEDEPITTKSQEAFAESDPSNAQTLENVDPNENTDQIVQVETKQILPQSELELMTDQAEILSDQLSQILKQLTAKTSKYNVQLKPSTVKVRPSRKKMVQTIK